MGEDFLMRIKKGFVKVHKEIRVMEIGPDLAMRYAQIFDGLPPLFQTTCKILAISTRVESFALMRATLWEVLNDLIAQGVDKEEMDIVLKEMEELYIIQQPTLDGQDCIKFLSPVSVY
jgi:hypothetical protein